MHATVLREKVLTYKAKDALVPRLNHFIFENIYIKTDFIYSN